VVALRIELAMLLAGKIEMRSRGFEVRRIALTVFVDVDAVYTSGHIGKAACE
jgi:hypothetical protein